MKTFLLLALLTVQAAAQAQAVLRVNNTPGVNAPYTTIDGAIAAASAGDIILVEGSTSNYTLPNNYTITKRVHIKGPGYFLDQNLNLQAGTAHASISLFGVLAFDAGSEGSSIQGMTVYQQAIAVRVSNITIRHNRLFVVRISNTTTCTNLNIQQNILGESPTFGGSVVGYTGSGLFTNINISNNICLWVIDLSANCFGLFANNYVVVGSDFRYPTNLGNLNVANCIFNGNTGSTTTFLVSTVQNNVFCGSGYYPAFDAALNNLTNQNISSMFTGTGSTDASYALKSLSPAIGVGIGGTDAGIFGGASPYRLSGIATGQHTVNNLTVPATVLQNGTLNVKVSAKVN